MSTAVGVQDQVVEVSDGLGGAIVAWHDSRTDGGDIYVQRVSASGAVLWTANGVLLSGAAGTQSGPAIAPDGMGGAIVAWQDTRVDANGDVFSQRVNASGVAQWAVDGVALVTGSSGNGDVQMVPDGVGGAILVFQDNRNPDGSLDPNFGKVWGQRVSGGGAALWGNGVAVGAAAFAHGNARLVADGNGGAIVAWQDGRVFGNWNISAQHVDVSGTALWVANGISLCSAAGQQTLPVIATDGSGGAIAAWTDTRTDPSDVYAQRTCVIGGTLVGVSDQATPRAHKLGQNRPNPFNPSSVIPFTLARAGRVTIRIYDVAGRLVRILIDENRPAGQHAVRWDGRLENGSAVTSGIYPYRITFPDGSESARKMAVVR